MRGRCSPEQRAACPLTRCLGSDLHHQAYPSSQYETKTEKRWRELPFNTVQLARCVHEAIHSSGYIPRKPAHEDMLSEIWSSEIPERAMLEQDKQIFLGEINLLREPEDIA